VGGVSIRLMTDVWDTKIGPATTRLVLLALADQANDEGVCWPFMATIASRAGCGLSTARKACAELEAQGLLRREYRKAEDGDNDRNIYVVNADKLTELAGAARSERGSAKKEREGPLKSGGGAARIERHNPQGTPKEEPKDSAAPASEALFEVPKQGREEEAAPKTPTINQRANALAGRHYERLGKMGNVPAFAKIAKQALVHDWPDDAVDKAMAYIAENNWTLTAERLANTLRGGPKPPSRPAPGRPSTAARLVGNQLLEG
jgi:hypothetical protein